MSSVMKSRKSQYEEYVFDQSDYYSIIDRAHRGKRRRAIDAVQHVKFKPRVNEKVLERGQIVKNVMKLYKLSLGEASKFIKDHELYVKKQ